MDLYGPEKKERGDACFGVSEHREGSWFDDLPMTILAMKCQLTHGRCILKSLRI